MDAEVLRLKAHLDQTRSEMAALVRHLGSDEVARLIKICARGQLADLDDQEQLMIGMLAMVAVFDLIEQRSV